MSLIYFLCDACGAVFELEAKCEVTDQPVECPQCHSTDTQLLPSLSSVYGYDDSDSSVGSDFSFNGFS